MKIILASHNGGKLNELRTALSSLHWQLSSLADFDIPDVAETGLTFVENALIKARHACHNSHLPAIADDSGLVVPALNNAPGIYSARYAGEHGNGEANIKKLLAELSAAPEQNRAAYFYCVLAYLEHAEDPAPIISEGIWYGHILPNPVGSQGFGYDPIFYVSEQQCSAAELPIEQKNRISHRGKALKSLIEKLNHRKNNLPE